ncbi:MAG TPA: hypothetical protein G4O04_00425 [Anaerolineae bacterium]|nr:hypothetical protein [Anaerolineae bacterium]HID84866.1 hypothetical protein [Anaerolineales bacterium]HIQ09041.1 hypothetical protein [Anaerolineaceae bacterium]
MFKKIIILLVSVLVLTASLVAPSQVYAFSLTPTTNNIDGSAIQAQTTAIAQEAQNILVASQHIQVFATQIQRTETDPQILSLAASLIALTSQSEQDAAAIMVTAQDINTRIDNSETTTLALSADIGAMADRIGEMADRILWTELQIGIMADRIVESEYLISDSSLTLAQMILDEQHTIAGPADSILINVAAIQALLP